MSSALHRFGIDPSGDPAAQWPKLCQLLEALVTNPFLHVGSRSSTLALPVVGSVAAALPREARPPFTPSLIRTDGSPSTYEVTISKGFVLERLVIGGAECVVPHLPVGIVDPEDPTALVRHPITAGQWIIVTVNSLPSGSIGIDSEEDPPPPPVLITIGDEESNHYEPPIGEGNEGAPGVYHYRLAQFDGEKLVPASGVAGQHIDHWAELPTFESAGGESVWKEWDAEAGVYRTRGVEGIRQIDVSGTEDTIQVGGNDRNVKVRFIEEDASEPVEGEDINFEDGLNMDGEVAAEELANRDITLPIVTSGGGITVTRTGAKNRNFLVELDGAGDGDNFDIDLVAVEVDKDESDDIQVFRLSSTTRFFIRDSKITRVAPDDGGTIYDRYDMISYIEGATTDTDDVGGTFGYYPAPPPE